jgi:hypothetical protein
MGEDVSARPRASYADCRVRASALRSHRPLWVSEPNTRGWDRSPSRTGGANSLFYGESIETLMTPRCEPGLYAYDSHAEGPSTRGENSGPSRGVAYAANSIIPSLESWR